MRPAPAEHQPDRSVQLVESRGGLRCMPLDIDNDNVGVDDELLLRTYSPRFVLLPDMDPNPKHKLPPRPYPDGKNDYHPRPVEVYLDRVSVVRQVPRRWLGWLNVFYTIGAYLLAIAAGVLVLVKEDGAVVVGAIATALAIVGIGAAYWYRYRYDRPDDAAALAQRTRGSDRGRAFAMTVFGTPGAGSPELAWKQYRAAIAPPKGQPPAPPEAPGGSTVYGRVHHDHGLTVLQYWLFYYYNDWWNQHEGDWEVAMVFLNGHEPILAACSAHLGGTWRPWRSVECVGGTTHPTIYVARGSHAMYFDTAHGVHDAVLHQPWAVFDIRGKLTVRGKQDRVGSAVLPGDRYLLEVIPDTATHVNQHVADWAKWWWLTFEGRWGAKDGILSPPVAEGGLRWDRPVDWVTAGEADIGSLADIIQASARSSRRESTAEEAAPPPAERVPGVAT